MHVVEEEDQRSKLRGVLYERIQLTLHALRRQGRRVRDPNG